MGLFCAEESVSRVAESGNDICVIVQLFVKCSGVDLYIGLVVLKSFNALGCCYEAKELNLGASSVLEH